MPKIYVSKEKRNIKKGAKEDKQANVSEINQISLKLNFIIEEIFAIEKATRNPQTGKSLAFERDLNGKVANLNKEMDYKNKIAVLTGKKTLK